MSSDKVMEHAEKLYQKGIISYPRTETDIYSPNIDLNKLIKEHQDHDQWGQYVR